MELIRALDVDADSLLSYAEFISVRALCVCVFCVCEGFFLGGGVISRPLHLARTYALLTLATLVRERVRACVLVYARA